MYPPIHHSSAVLYRCDPMGLQQDCLANLPKASVAADVVRLCYAVVCVTSYPLCLAPLADMTERAFFKCEEAHSNSFSAAALLPSCCANDALQRRTSSVAALVVPTRSLAVRLALIATGTAVAIVAPDFGLIVSIIGSFSVSLLSFVLPSAMHLAIAAGDVIVVEGAAHSSYLSVPGAQTGRGSSSGGALQVVRGLCSKQEFVLEGFLLVLGAATCALTTSLTVLSFMAG